MISLFVANLCDRFVDWSSFVIFFPFFGEFLYFSTLICRGRDLSRIKSLDSTSNLLLVARLEQIPDFILLCSLRFVSLILFL